jgi:hypothetical protein
MFVLGLWFAVPIMLERREWGVGSRNEAGEQGAGGKGENIKIITSFPSAPCSLPLCLFSQCPILNFTQIFLKNLNIWYTSLVFLKKS